jgi:hypothetical protein
MKIIPPAKISKPLRAAELVPGVYMRDWAGFRVRVRVVLGSDGNIWEIVPSPVFVDPETMPGAKWFPVSSASEKGRRRL